MYDCFYARVYVHSAITLTATLALMLCYLDVIDSMSLSFNPTYRIERCLLFWASVASSRKCRDRLGTRKKFRVNRPDFQHKRQSSLDSLARSCKKIARMRGRGDGRFQSRGGGRGRYGRGQGETHKPIVKGRKPEVGAYLDLPRGQAADPEAVLKWH